jgi:hypothetical protein
MLQTPVSAIFERRCLIRVRHPLATLAGICVRPFAASAAAARRVMGLVVLLCCSRANALLDNAAHQPAKH